jgi:hypothetical protein
MFFTFEAKNELKTNTVCGYMSTQMIIYWCYVKV